MGTKVQSESYLPGFYSMKDLNDDSNSCSWPFYYGDNKTLTNGSYYNGYLPQTIADAYPGYDKDVVKRTMLEHEAIFKNQVSELHRLYRIQRDLMDETKRKELHKNRMLIESSLSSSPLASQSTNEDARRWHVSSFPGANSKIARPSFSTVEDIYSPYSSMQGKNMQVNNVLASQNGCTSKGIEVLDSRPAKVRKKLIDLQLPADEYIDDNDEGEQTKAETVSNLSSSFLNGNQKLASENGVKNFRGDGVKNGCQRDMSRPESSFRSTIDLADLNEPIVVEDTKASTFSDSLSCAPYLGDIQSSGPSDHHPKPGLFEPLRISSSDSHQERNNSSLNNQQLQNGRGWFAHVLESGKNKSNSKSVLQGIPPEPLLVFSQSSNILSTKPHESSFLTDHSNKIDMLGERKNCGLDISERNHHRRYPAAPSSDLTKSWSPSVSSWEKLSSSLNQNSISARAHPCGNLNKSPQSSSSQCQGIFADRWHLNGNVRVKPSNESESSDQNGFYGAKELPVCIPSAHYEYLNNCNNNRNLTSEQFSNQSSARVSKDSNCVNVKFAKEVNLNVAISNGSADDVVVPQSSFEIGKKHEDHPIAGLPWLKATPARNNKANGQNVKPVSCFGIGVGKTKINDCPSNMKILGVSILDKPHANSSSGTVPSSSRLSCQPEEVKNDRRYRLLDMNLPCEPETGSADFENVIAKKEVGFQIDLNLCVSEDEASLMSPVPSTMTVGFDLEAPVILESDEDVPQLPEKLIEAPVPPSRHRADLHEDSIKMAAEAIVSISSYNSHNDPSNVTEASTRDPLQWFSDIVSCCGEELENKYEVIARMCEANKKSPLEEIDYFEYMTLNLTETTEKDYMPKPLVPEHINLDEAGPSRVQARPRKGQARRGRQRRDFQRDILPGLTSLSRLEVTEDLQTFGGLMQATGHTWSGLTRRNGCGRGRKRAVATTTTTLPSPPVAPPLVQQINNIEVTLEDRNLTGWGKTTRRPRRQRCPPPAGNPLAVPLT